MSCPPLFRWPRRGPHFLHARNATVCPPASLILGPSSARKSTVDPTGSVYSITLKRRQTSNSSGSWTSTFCDVASWRHTEKVERKCTNLPVFNATKSFPYFNTFAAKSLSQSVLFKNRDEQTHPHKQTNKQTTSSFSSPLWRAKSELHQTPQGDEKTLSTFLHLQNVFGSDVQERWTFWGNSTPQLKIPRNSGIFLSECIQILKGDPT